MTRSASTPRLRATQGFYAVLALSGLVVSGPAWPAWMAVLALWTGFVCVAAACLGRIWCSAHIAGRKDVALVTEGPYAWCRHPLYAWSLLAAFGLGLATLTLTWPIAALVVLGLLLRQEIRREERLLAERHGAAFTGYAARTPALWPRRPPGNGSHRASEFHLRPDIFRKAFLDAGSMLLLYSLVAAIAVLRRAGAALPQWLQLP